MYPITFLLTETAATEIYTLSLHDALPISDLSRALELDPDRSQLWAERARARASEGRSEEHTSELQSLRHLVCRLLLEKKITAIHCAGPTGKQFLEPINVDLAQIVAETTEG